MVKITILGYSGSGKSSYISVMAQSLFQGIHFSNGLILKVGSQTSTQMIQLHRTYQQIMNGLWPKGTWNRVEYKFYCTLGQEQIMNFVINDYRGGLLSAPGEEDMEEYHELFSSFEDSNIFLFFIRADVIKRAINGDDRRQFVRWIMRYNLIYLHLRSTISSKTPIMIVITKADLLSYAEKKQAKDLVLDKLRKDMFATTTIAITMISLGRNIKKQSELKNDFSINSIQENIHIPVLYSLFCVLKNRLEESIDKLKAVETSCPITGSKMGRNLFPQAFSNTSMNCGNKFNLEIRNVLNKLTEIISVIKPLLLNGADVYINGVKR